jgi:putative hydrolase of the HAD superfamily
MEFKAVLWDLGGVITSSPFEAFARYEDEVSAPKDIIRRANSINPDTNAWAKLERSDCTLEEFDELFAAETEALGHRIQGAQVLALLAGDIRPEMVNAVKIIGQHYNVGCITNNVNTGEGAGMARTAKKAAAVQEVMTNFEFVLESSKAGVRKPDPKIYQMACEKINITPNQAIYLDDLGINLKPAKKLGMTTIKVIDPADAIAELERLLDLKLS